MTISIDEATRLRLEKIARDEGRAMDELARCAVEEAALDYFRRKNMRDDPAKGAPNETL